jgi:hypothetical protein
VGQRGKAMRLKNHETPRKMGRNEKSKKRPVALRHAKARKQSLKRKLGLIK